MANDGQQNREILEKSYLSASSYLQSKVGEYRRLMYALLYHKNIRGQAMVFEDKPYLLDIYKDDAREIILQSSVQTGKSEFLIIAALSYAEIGMQVLYAFPTIELRNLFVSNRIDNLIARVPYYQEVMKRSVRVADARGLKNFGDGSIFFGGSNSSTTFIEKPLDVLIADELDRFNIENYEKADDRLTASPHKIKYEASNPTVDNYGIHRRYLVSDQRVWKVACPHCKHRQEMDWFENVVFQDNDGRYRLIDSEWNEFLERDIFIHCRKCFKPLNRFTHDGGWVARAQKKDVHGYHIHQMLSSYVSVRTMWNKFLLGLEDNTSMQVFYNSILGTTFSATGSKIDDAILLKCKQQYNFPVTVSEPCVMGIDVGKKLNVVVRQICSGDVMRLVYAGTIRDFEELEVLFERFNIVSYAIDVRPETRKATELVRSHKRIGRGWMIEYCHGLLEVTQNEETRIAKCDRTMAMDKVQLRFLRGLHHLPSNYTTLDNGDYCKQIKIPTRIFDEEKGVYTWLGDPDHYYHAEVYCNLAYSLRGEFKVVGISLNGATSPAVQKPPKEFPMHEFPAGTDKAQIEYYRRLWEDGMNQNKD